jgi:hypothetical protein
MRTLSWRPPSLRVPSLLLASIFAASLVLTSCGGSSSGTSSAPTATQPPATATATRTPVPTQNTLAWVQIGSKGAIELHASVNGAAPHIYATIPQLVNGCGYVDTGPAIFSPDLAHIAFALGFGCTDGQYAGPLLVVDAATSATITVPLPQNASVISEERDYAWIDSTHLVIVGYSGAYVYPLGGSASKLPGISSAVEGIARGTTLFYLTNSGFGAGLHSQLHRYDLNAKQTLPGAIDLGSFGSCQCSPGNFFFQGWDVSPDGAHVVYQVTTPKNGDNMGAIASSHIYYANADGSGATQIARYMATTSLVRMRLSPDGSQVAITNALPTPSVISACVNSPGDKADPCFHAYTPDAVDLPAWSADGRSFVAATLAIPDSGGTGSHPALYRYTVGSSAGAQIVTGGFQPWSGA